MAIYGVKINIKNSPLNTRRQTIEDMKKEGPIETEEPYQGYFPISF